MYDIESFFEGLQSKRSSTYWSRRVEAKSRDEWSFCEARLPTVQYVNWRPCDREADEHSYTGGCAAGKGRELVHLPTENICFATEWGQDT